MLRSILRKVVNQSALTMTSAMYALVSWTI
jgi:hypothetical protein